MIAWLLECPLVVRDEPFVRYDAIVVLGAPLGRRDGMSPILAERVAAAVALYHRGGAPLVVVTGGVTSGGRAEADVMADALRAADVPADAIVVERASRTTRANAALTAPLLAARGARSAWIVTQPFHTRRAVRVFRTAGIDAHAWHITDSLEYTDRTRARRWLVREYAAWLKLFALLASGRG